MSAKSTSHQLAARQLVARISALSPEHRDSVIVMLEGAELREADKLGFSHRPKGAVIRFPTMAERKAAP